MRRGNLTEGSNPSLSATMLRSPKIGHFVRKNTLSATNYDTFDRKKDTFNLCKVNDIYYFRIRINNKLYRKSLKTSNLKKAIVRSKLLKSMQKEELVEMFQLKDKDYHLLFEYDNIEELQMLLETFKTMKSIEIKQDREDAITLQREQPIHHRGFEQFTFEDLELEFLTSQKKLGKISESSFKNYNSCFVKLKQFFLKKDINTLTYKDFESFRDSLIEKKLESKTINNLMSYVNQFLEFAAQRRTIEYNAAKSIKALKEEKKYKENFTDEEILEILDRTYQLKDKPHMFPLFLVAAYTGMRFNEILDINEDSIKVDKIGIRYIDIGASKTSSGVRKVPLHSLLENFDFSPLYPLSSKNKNKYNKEMLRVLYTIIPKEKGKTFHLLRGTFVNRAVNKFPDKISIVQEIVGHSKGSQSITLDTYSKEFNLDLKKEIIDSVEYT